MKFGFFDDQNKEYVITTPRTPLPWINYLGSKDFFSLISNTCGGYSALDDVPGSVQFHIRRMDRKEKIILFPMRPLFQKVIRHSIAIRGAERQV